VDSLAQNIDDDAKAERQTLARVRYTHDAVIDEILINPAVSQGDLAKQFGFTQAWMSIVINSDAFQNRLAERKGELIDPKIRASIQERLDAVARRSMDRIMERLDGPGAIKDGDLVAMAKLGIGDRNNRVAAPVTQNNLYVVALPAPAPNAQAWLDNRSDRTPRPLEIVQEVARG
jgi:hypothetical protein